MGFAIATVTAWLLLGRSSRRTAIDRHDERDVEFYQARQERSWKSIVLISRVTGEVPREVDCESATWYSLDDCLQRFCVGREERIGLRNLLWNRIAVSIGNGQVVRGISGGLIRVSESLASQENGLSELKAARRYDGSKNGSVARDSEYSRQFNAPSIE